MAGDTETSSPDAAPASPAPVSGAPSASGRRRAWMPRGKARGAAGRWVGRLAVVALLLALVGWMAWLLWAPFLHPNTHLVFLTGGDYQLLGAPPVAFVAEDFAALKPLEITLHQAGTRKGPQALANLRSPQAMAELSEKLAETLTGNSDVLIVCLSAHGIAQEGTAFVACRNFDSANPAAGLYRLSELLTAISDCPAAVKLLVLDAGRIEADGRLGLVSNEFPRLLEREVEATHDPALWVLAANRELERSHVSPSLERSVFGYFVSEGLSGEADLDRDREIRLDELARYVATQVAAWVQQTSASEATQTPLLLWGGGPEPPATAGPVLLSVSPLVAKARRESLAKAVSRARERSRSGALSRVTADLDASSLESAATSNVPPLGGQVGQEATNAGSSAARTAMESTAAPTGAPEAAAPPSEQPADGQGQPATTPQAAVPAGGGGAPPATPGKEQAQPVQPAGSTAVPAAAEAPEGAAANVPTDAERAATLLAEAWRLRDELEARRPGVPSPVDYAPHLWREFQEWLLAQERRYRAGSISDPKQIAKDLEAVLPSLRRLRANAPAIPPRKKDRRMGDRLAERLPHELTTGEQPRSLAAAELAAAHGGPPLAASIRTASAALERLTQQGSADELSALAKTLKPEHDRFVELRLARRLAGLAGVDWPVTQLALATCWRGERVAAVAAGRLGWAKNAMEEADRLRRTGERELTDRIGRDRQEVASRLLREAMTQYEQAETDLALVTAATNLNHDLAYRAVDYVRWRNAAGLLRDGGLPQRADLEQMLAGLAQLESVLDDPDPARLADVRKLHAQLVERRDRIAAASEASAVKALTTLPATAGDAERIEALLATPLARAAERLSLLAASGEIEGQLASRFAAPLVGRAGPLPKDITAADWRLIVGRAELELGLARLALAGSAEAGQRLAPLEVALTALAAAEHSAAQSGPSVADADALWTALREFGSALEDFHRSQPQRIEAAARQFADLSDPADRHARLVALRQAVRGLRLLDGHDAFRVTGPNPAALVRGAELYDLWTWHARRFERALVDAPVEEAGFLAESVDVCRVLAQEIAGQPPLPTLPATRLTIEAPTALPLTTEDERAFDVTLRASGAASTSAWVVLKYDPELLEVRALGATPVQQEKLATAETAGEYPDWRALAPTAQLQADLPQTLRLVARRKVDAAPPTRIVIRAITGETTVRGEVEVALPVPQAVELAVKGIPASWTTSADGFVCHPFPNRRTEFQLGVVNPGVRDRTVDVELLTLGQPRRVRLPRAALSAADAATLLEELAPTEPLAAPLHVVVPPGGKWIALPFPKTGEEGGAATTGAGAPAAAAPAAPPAGEAAEQKPGVPLDDGLVAVVTDVDTGLKTIQRIDFAPQRPRRYLRARVGYNYDHQQLEIRVGPQDKSLLPPGEVRVECDLAGQLPQGAEARLSGVVQAPGYEAFLFAKVPPDPEKVLTVSLTVDGYPRAFLFRVPCGAESHDLPDAADALAIRILAPAAGAQYPAGTATIPVQVEVDVPPGGLERPEDFVEVGIDQDRDRDLADEATVRLPADRQGVVDLAGLAPGGVMAVRSRVEDFSLDVPATGLANARVGVLGRVSSGGEMAWSEEVEIVVDGEPPRMERIELVPPGRVTQGEELTLWALCSDGDLSGVTKVEAAFDLAGTGMFGAAPLVPALRTPNGRWEAKLPTAELKPGTVRLLVRATDAVGNESEISSVPVEVQTAEEAAADMAQKTNRLSGSISYGGQPVPDVEVKLEAAAEAAGAVPPTGPAPAKIAPVKSDSKGVFVFPKVPPGKYKLSAEGVVRNKLRKAQADVTVTPPPANVKYQRLTLE